MPVAAMQGDSLLVSAFEDHADGTFPQGAAAYEKRGVAVDVPEWNPENCIQCNQCAYVCPHATIRPFAMDEKEAANAPAATKFTAKMIGKGCEGYKFTMAISPLTVWDAAFVYGVCPTKPEKRALKMVPQESQMDQQAVFDYAVANVTKKETSFCRYINQGQPVSTSRCLNSQAHAQDVLKPLTQDSLLSSSVRECTFSNATGCSSIWGGSAPSTPYTVNRDSERSGLGKLSV